MYGSGRVLSTVRLGDVFAFYPLTHVQHPENSTPPLLATLTVAAKEEVTDAATLMDVSAWAHTTATDKTNGLMAFGDGSVAGPALRRALLPIYPLRPSLALLQR